MNFAKFSWRYWQAAYVSLY